MNEICKDCVFVENGRCKIMRVEVEKIRFISGKCLAKKVCDTL